MSDRFHRAARDGVLNLLKEATRKDCNTKDDDGMTPTLWAAFEGNAEALRLLVARGGDPEKCDNYGSTALHCAAARGHMNCVTFLLNYSVNIYAKDIDHHTAKDLAAMHGHDDILRILDEQAAKQSRSDPKKVKALMDKADKDADKRVKDYEKIKEKAKQLAEKEKKRLEKERKRMEEKGHHDTAPGEQEGAGANSTIIPRPSLMAMNLRRDSRLVYGQSPKFSDLVNQKEDKDKIKLPVSAVYKKVLQHRKTHAENDKAKENGSVSASSGTGTLNNNNKTAGDVGDFKVGAMEDGKRSVRSISGLRRDSEIMYVPKYDDSNGKRTGLDNVFPSAGSKGFSGRDSKSDYLVMPDSTFGDDDGIPAYQPPRASIFDRPGFGGLAFRNSIAALSGTTSAPPVPQSPAGDGDPRTSEVDATVLNHNQRARKGQWDQDELESDEDEDEDEGKTPMHFFLSAVGLEEFIEPFVKEKFDLDSLMLVGESDLVAMGIPRGHRLKLMRAIAERKAALEDPDDELEDSRL